MRHVTPALEDALGAREAFIPRGLSTTHPIFITRAEGSRVWDSEGRESLDFASGISVLNIGHRHPRVVAAAHEQLDRLMHTCFQVAMYEPYVAVAARLSRLVAGPSAQPHKAVLFTTGAEATENAVKIARAFTRRSAVIAFSGGFHGRTLLALTMTASSPSYRQNFGPLAAEVYHAPYPDAYHGWTTARALAALDRLFHTEVTPDRVAAIIIEPQQGEGGFVVAPPEFLQHLRTLATRHGIVLVVDEIQSGFGRTGRMWAYEHAGIAPDLVTVAKSLGGGLPLSAVVGRAEMMDAPLPGGLGGTYAGNPVACAAALAVLDVFEDEDIVARAGRVGQTLRTALDALQGRTPAIGEVRGLGAMLALEFVKHRETREPDADLAERVIVHARAGGLLLLKCGPEKNVVRLLPPLVASAAELAGALSILEAAIVDAEREGAHP